MISKETFNKWLLWFPGTWILSLFLLIWIFWIAFYRAIKTASGFNKVMDQIDHYVYKPKSKRGK